MGCDSHPYVEVKNSNGEWELVDYEEKYRPEWDAEAGDYVGGTEKAEALRAQKTTLIDHLGCRNYRMFAALADVRNRGDDVKPLFPHRGVPDDISEMTRHYFDENGSDYHSPTYFTLSELMDVNWDAPCSHLSFSFLGKQYADWKDTGVLDVEKVEETLQMKSRAWNDPVAAPNRRISAPRWHPKSEKHQQVCGWQKRRFRKVGCCL